METCRNVRAGSLCADKGRLREQVVPRLVYMATVTLKNVKKIYDNKVTAVHDFNLEIADKEFIVLVGPSGCGKSTTLRMIAGLEEISEGDLLIGDKRMNDVEPKDRDIAMVFQNYALYPHMTVYENMAFSLQLRKTPKDEIDRKVREAAEILDITSYLERKPKALSGGQRQRVAIGRAIVRNPQVFLMDEPLSNLDAKLRNQMRAEIIKLRQRIDTTFIYVTHGSPQMNLFDAKLIKTESGYQVEVQGAVMPLSKKIQSSLAAKSVPSQAVKLGIRPEHIHLEETAGTHTISSKVDVSEMMGSEIHLHVDANGKDVVLRIPTTDLAEEYRGGMGYGTEILFTFREDLIHLFDLESGANLL